MNKAYKLIKRTITISPDIRKTIDLNAEVYSQDIDVTKILLMLNVSNGEKIDLSNATVHVALQFGDTIIEDIGQVENIEEQTISYCPGNTFKYQEGLVTMAFYLYLGDAQRIDICHFKINFKRSLIDSARREDIEPKFISLDAIIDEALTDVQKKKMDFDSRLEELKNKISIPESLQNQQLHVAYASDAVGTNLIKSEPYINTAPSYSANLNIPKNREDLPNFDETLKCYRIIAGANQNMEIEELVINRFDFQCFPLEWRQGMLGMVILITNNSTTLDNVQVALTKSISIEMDPRDIRNDLENYIGFQLFDDNGKVGFKHFVVSDKPFKQYIPPETDLMYKGVGLKDSDNPKEYVWFARKPILAYADARTINDIYYFDKFTATPPREDILNAHDLAIQRLRAECETYPDMIIRKTNYVGFNAFDLEMKKEYQEAAVVNVNIPIPRSGSFNIYIGAYCLVNKTDYDDVYTSMSDITVSYGDDRRVVGNINSDNNHLVAFTHETNKDIPIRLSINKPLSKTWTLRLIFKIEYAKEGTPPSLLFDYNEPDLIGYSNTGGNSPGDYTWLPNPKKEIIKLAPYDDTEIKAEINQLMKEIESLTQQLGELNKNQN